MRRRVIAVCALAGASCQPTPTNVALHALNSAGPLAFVCLGDPSLPLSQMALPLDRCPRYENDDFSVPHLYALTTQPLRGEVAVVDLTVVPTDLPALIDADPSTPGTQFMPVGAEPTDLVATPGGMASFVTVAEPGFEGIYALPAAQIRGGSGFISDWPSCALPSRPERVALVVDPADKAGAVRPSCDAAHGAEDASPPCGPNHEQHCHGDLDLDAANAGTPGRYKLIVTLPKAGGIAVIDAQAILDQEAGAFQPCRVERFLPLKVDLTPEPGPPVPSSPACIPPLSPLSVATGYRPTPAGIAVAKLGGGGTRAYLADRVAPEIHRVDLPTPCEPAEIAPLLATSAEDPTRIVTTSRVAVSPLTLDLRRFVYAIDDEDGSIISYDASEGSESRLPMTRPHPEWNPFQPADRIRFGSPPREIVPLRYTADLPDDNTGATLAVRCDPSPHASPQAAKYQTSADLTTGAGPTHLRGVFAFAVLASGNALAIDVDDFDAPCRGPVNHDPLFGCGDEAMGLTGASGEYSCNAVAPQQPRAAGYLLFRESLVNNQPGIQAPPLLFDLTGTVLTAGVAGNPRMRATVPVKPSTELAPEFVITVGTEQEPLDPATGLPLNSNGAQKITDQHILAMNYEDPRAHILNQGWSVTYEGALPGFGTAFADLNPTGSAASGKFEVRDSAIRFCAQGVLGAGAVADSLVQDEGLSQKDAATQAQGLADYFQIISDTPVATDKYWTEQDACTFSTCQQTYGSSIDPLSARDFRIDVAKQDALEISPRGTEPSPPVKCCFPNVVQFNIRGGGQWIVVGSQVGFLHHDDADAQGICRPKCDPTLARLNGRARNTDKADEVVTDADPRAFINPFFRFAINPGDVKRDTAFQFSTQGAFGPLQLPIVTGTTDVQPAAARFLPLTGELVVADGSQNGLDLIDLGTLAISRQYQ